MIHSCIEPVVDKQLLREQAGSQQGRSAVDQVALLMQDSEDSFQDKKKAEMVLLDLAEAYDTVWHHDLHPKLQKTIPDRHMVKFIMDMVSNHQETSNGQQSRLRRLRNGPPRCLFSHQCCLTSTSTTYQRHHPESIVMQMIRL